MTRVARTKSRSFTYQGTMKTYWHLPNRASAGTANSTRSGSATLSDSHGRPIVDSPFNISSAIGWPSIDGDVVIDYAWATQRWQYVFNKYTQAIVGYPDDTPLSAPGGWYLSVVAGTNPSRPILTIPTLIEDLVDIPKQIRELGKFLLSPKSQLNAKGVANQFLGWKFGWLPLFDDLHQLLDLQALIIKRNKELHSLYSGKGLRRRLKFDDTTISSDGSVSILLIGDGSSRLEVLYDHMVKKRSWATIHWKPTTPPPYHPDDERWNALSRRLVLGLTPEGVAKGLWDVIPWTWLLGWFNNVGKYTLAYSNTIPAAHSEACFMSEVIGKSIIKGINHVGIHEGFATGSGARVVTKKSRVISGSLTPGFNMPYLDMSRLSVLSALAIQRIRR